MQNGRSLQYHLFDARLNKENYMFGIFDDIVKATGSVVEIVTKPIELITTPVSSLLEEFADEVNDVVDDITDK